jgi:hypothetical protein
MGVKLVAGSRIDDRKQDQTGDIPATVSVFVVGFSPGGDTKKRKVVLNIDYRV